MDLIEFIKVAKIKPDTKKDQYFLVDSKILDHEANLLKLNENDVVMEIGAGFGPLTVRLAQKCRVLAVENDDNLADFLRRIKNTVAMNNDILKILEEARRDKRTGAFNKIAGNIPYSISQDILLEILKHPWEIAVLCVQKEFAEKITKEKTKLACIISDCCDARIEMNIPAEKFYPKAVESSILVLKQKKQMDENYWKFLEKLFKSKNKNIGNVFPKSPAKYKTKKTTQLTMKEIKEFYESFQK